MSSTSQQNLQRIMFATSNLQQLRGLTMLPVGFWLVALPFIGHLSSLQPLLALTLLVVCTAIAIEANRRIKQYYERTYGTVRAAGWKGFPATGTAIWVLLLVYILVVAHQPTGPSLLVLWVAAFFWGMYMSSSGYRWHYLILTVFFAAMVPFWNSIPEVWQWAIIGLSFAAAGIADHMLLTKLLPVPLGGDPGTTA
jgi:hypothetical protein